MEVLYHGCSTALAPPSPCSSPIPPPFSPPSIIIHILLSLCFLCSLAHGLGSMSTLAISSFPDGHAYVCGILQGSVQGIQCWNSRDNSVARSSPTVSPFSGITGGQGFLCGIRDDTLRPLCWDLSNISLPKRLKNDAFSDIVAGDTHVCALLANGTNGAVASCWRNRTIIADIPPSQSFLSLSSGADFVCGLKASDSSVQCWGLSASFRVPNASFVSIYAGTRHACGLTAAFNVQCWGDDTSHQSTPPDGSQFLSLALGESHSCGIDAFSRTAVCWGDGSLNQTTSPAGLIFSTIVAADSFTCGLLYPNFTVFCWGGSMFGSGKLLPLSLSIPSTCSATACNNGSFQVGNICASSQQHSCMPCRIGCQPSEIQTGQCQAQQDTTCSRLSPSPSPGASPSPISSSPEVTVVRYTNRLSKGLIVLIAFGAFGALCGVLAIGWCICMKFGVRMGFPCDTSQGRVHSSTGGALPSLAVPSPRIMRRQRSSTSSMRSRGEARSQAFTIAEMAAATMDFSEENKIGAGSFGVVYRGILQDGREVAIKRGEREAVANDRKVEEKESAFQSELELLSRLHHKHLVSLVGYCDEEDERMLVYEFMPNGTLHDHLHGRSRGAGREGALPWQMRIKIALEAARGVEYLHTYAVPPIIHRDIKSSNILLDSGWTARVSDFGLSTRGPGENSHLSLMAAGTLGYMDPEYYRLQHLTIKSDVYSFGVVLLELITGERAIHKASHGPVNIVDYAAPRIAENKLVTVLDQRPGTPTLRELKALEVIAQLAVKCVQLEGKERPTMTEIVAALEEAMILGSNGRSKSYSGGGALSSLEAGRSKSHSAVIAAGGPVSHEAAVATSEAEEEDGVRAPT